MTTDTKRGDREQLFATHRPVSVRAPSRAVPIHLLDTANNRRLMSLLEESYVAALAVDYERGYGHDGPAQVLADWLGTVREEIYGPTGQRE